MKEYAMLCVVGLIGCRGGGDVKSGSADTVAVAGPPAVTVAPTLPKTIASSQTSRRAATGRNKTAKTSIVTPASVVADSVRGIVSVVGSDRDRRVMIARPGGGRRVEVTGPLTRLIGHLAGADVAVVGTTSGNSLEATSFLVRTIDGAAAIDGTLRIEGPALYLVTIDGRRIRIVAPPPPLLGHDGARVWITGDPARGVASFGFIDPPG